MRRCRRALLAAALLALRGAAAPAAELPAAPLCAAPADLTHARYPLAHLSQRLAAGRPATIVAIGSSSTFGYAASSPDASYPSQLQRLLRTAFPEVPVTVVNRGVSGEDARDMIARFDRDVFALHPDLTIWQFGTNAVVRRQSLDPALHEMLRAAVHRLEEAGDVLLMDLQVAPMVTAQPAHEVMLREIATLGKTERVGVVRRFALMQSWLAAGQFTPATMLAADGLHMNDASYACLADAVARQIVDGVAPPRPATLARH